MPLNPRILASISGRSCDRSHPSLQNFSFGYQDRCRRRSGERARQRQTMMTAFSRVVERLWRSRQDKRIGVREGHFLFCYWWAIDGLYEVGAPFFAFFAEGGNHCSRSEPESEEVLLFSTLAQEKSARMEHPHFRTRSGLTGTLVGNVIGRNSRQGAFLGWIDRLQALGLGGLSQLRRRRDKDHLCAMKHIASH